MRKNEQVILDLITSYGGEIKMTNHDIAIELKLSIGQVSKALSELKKLNLIRMETFRKYTTCWITRRTITLQKKINEKKLNNDKV